MTIDQLISEAIKAKAKFGGDKYVLVSNDEEGNGYHECYYSFSGGEDILDVEAGVDYPYDLEPSNCVVLG